MGEHDLISRAALQKSMAAVVFKNVPVEHQPYMQVVCDTFAHLVNEAPAVDAEPVVRCKDCRHWDRTRRTPSGSHFCFCTMMHTAENHYCGHGRKMAEE